MTTQADPNEEALKPKLTAEFLDTLAQACRVVGWSVDAIESAKFVEEVHRIAGVKPPDDLQPL